MSVKYHYVNRAQKAVSLEREVWHFAVAIPNTSKKGTCPQCNTLVHVKRSVYACRHVHLYLYIMPIHQKHCSEGLALQCFLSDKFFWLLRNRAPGCTKILIQAYIAHACAKTLIHYAACPLVQTVPLALLAS